MPYDDSPLALTPWVRRLLVAMGAVYLLQLTVFTSPWLTETFGFIPSELARHPWSPLTYAFLHGSFLHLVFNSLALYMFGRPVEGRLGSGRFFRLFLLSAMGGAVLSFLLVPLAGNAAIVGASGAVYGVMLAFVLEWPDAPVLIFPLPMPVKAKWLVAFYVTADLLLGVTGASTGVAHFAHLGGLVAALLYLRAGAIFGRSRAPKASPSRAPAVLVRPPSGERMRRNEAFGAARRQGTEAHVLDEMNRVLDKISERGMGSLTDEERRFLDEMSKRIRHDS